MPPEIKLNRRAMLDGAIAVIEDVGWDGVSARAVAARLGISTQPLYREFGDMDGLKNAARERGFEIFSEYLGDDALEQAAQYVCFAVERGKLFNFLFRGGSRACVGLGELSRSIIPTTGIIQKLRDITGLGEDEAYGLHLKLWMAIHGLACFAADNGVRLNSDEVKRFTVETSKALSAYIKAEREV